MTSPGSAARLAYFMAAGRRAIIVLTNAMVLTSEVLVSATTRTCWTRAIVMMRVRIDAELVLLVRHRSDIDAG